MAQRGEKQGRSDPPRSCNGYGVSVVGLLGFAIGLWASVTLDLAPAWRLIVLVSVTATPMVLWGLLVEAVHRRSEAGLDLRSGHGPDLGRSFTKLIGLGFTIALLGLGYWIFPVYRHALYEPFFELVWLALPWLGALTVFYVYWLDGRLAEPRDGSWHMGCVALLRWREVDWRKLRPYALGWVIKGYFLPIMLGWLAGNLNWMAGLDWSQPRPFVEFYDLGLTVIFSLDLAFAALGYLLTLRAIDGHIRSPEPTMLGWCVALICYPPFGDLMFDGYLTWSDPHQWRAWLEGSAGQVLLWGSVILVLECLFALCTVQFGFRFSNLTHRGILTHGLYRLTKHPAYITKCISFWLIAVPFVPAQGWPDAVRQSLMLAGICVVYWLRARTEERHLSQDPVYVEYALWIEQHGIFRWVGQLAPALRYRPPAEMPVAMPGATAANGRGRPLPAGVPARGR